MGVMSLLLALAACKQSGEQATAPQASDTQQEAAKKQGQDGADKVKAEIENVLAEHGKGMWPSRTSCRSLSARLTTALW